MSINRPPVLWTGLVIVAPFLFAAPSTAATYRAVAFATRTISSSFETMDSEDLSGFLNAGAGAQYDNTGGLLSQHILATASADAFGLRSASSTQLFKSQSGGLFSKYSITASSSAIGTWNDFIFTGPGSGNVAVSLNLHLTGSLSVATPNTASDLSRSIASGGLTVYIQGANIGGGGYSASSIDGSAPQFQSSDMLFGFDGDDVVVSPTFNVPLNTYFTVSLALNTAATTEAQSDEIFSISTNADFGNTLTFAVDRPVFNNVPAGYTVNSVDAGVINNGYSIPEPSTAALIAASALLLPRRRRVKN